MDCDPRIAIKIVHLCKNQMLIFIFTSSKEIMETYDIDMYSIFVRGWGLGVLGSDGEYL